MQLSQLGDTGLYVSRLSLGTMTLGEADKTSAFYGIGCKKSEAFAIIDHALAKGVNLLDTANIYGQDGMVEKLLGEYFSERKNRQGIVLGTKFRFGMGNLPHQWGASRKHIMDAVEDSLKRLRTDYIDLYQVHMEDHNTPEEETLRALDDLIKQGKVRYIGASNYSAHRFIQSHYQSKLYNLSAYCSLQMQYHLICRDIEREHVPCCLLHKKGILVWSPLAGGFLSGKYERNHIENGTRYSMSKDWAFNMEREKNWQIIAAVKQIANELDATPSQISLAWLLKKPGVTSVIVGARSLLQLEDNLRAVLVNLESNHMKQLDDISRLPKCYPYDFIDSYQEKFS
jgi:aryl-alcohol dehydrogenase-like predicted oxidoreductase